MATLNTLAPPATCDALLAAQSVAAAPTKLRLITADGLEQKLALPMGSTTIGGGPRCSLKLSGRGVRPLHCVITRDELGVTVRRWSEDTVLNGQSFSESPLTIGDCLQIAGAELWLLGEMKVPVEPESEVAELEAAEPIAAEPVAEAPIAEAPVIEELVAEVAAPVVPNQEVVATQEAVAAQTEKEVTEKSATENAEPGDLLASHSSETSFRAVPKHLLQPWLDAAPQAVESASDFDPNTDSIATTSGESMSRFNTFESLDSEPAVTPTSEVPISEVPVAEAEPAWVREALVQTRQRTRNLLTTLRAERQETTTSKVKHQSAIADRAELANKLVLVEAELASRTDSAEQFAAEQAKQLADAEAMVALQEQQVVDYQQELTERDYQLVQQNWLYEEAARTVAELEEQLTQLRDEHDQLEAEGQTWACQRGELENALRLLETQVTDLLAEREQFANAVATPAAGPVADDFDADAFYSGSFGVSQTPAQESEETLEETLAETPEAIADQPATEESVWGPLL